LCSQKQRKRGERERCYTARERGSRGGTRRSKGGKESGGRVPKGYGV